jgi:hypothetical protein
MTSPPWLTQARGRVASAPPDSTAWSPTTRARPVGRGQPYTTDGDVIKLQFDEIGETWGFRWSLYRGTLKLERDKTLGVPPELHAPTPLLVHPGNGSASGTPPDAYGGEAPASPLFKAPRGRRVARRLGTPLGTQTPVISR